MVGVGGHFLTITTKGSTGISREDVGDGLKGHCMLFKMFIMMHCIFIRGR